MKKLFVLAHVGLLALFACAAVNAADKDLPSPVRMGSGAMTFDTVPGWGLRPDGSSAIGPCHGGVVVDEAGNIYTSANAGVFVFSPEGQVIQSYLGGDYTNLHDIEIRKEGDHEFVYGARNQAAEGIKFNAHSGEVVLKLPLPEEAGLGKIKFSPTAITVAANGDIYLSNGYATNHIFKFDKDGKYLMHFGKKGNGMEEFNTAHGMTLDTRYEPARLLICDRNHQPKGRLLHYSLDGEFIGEVVTGLGMPTSVAIKVLFLICMVVWSYWTNQIRSLRSWVTIPIQEKVGTTTFHRINGLKGFSVALTGHTGMPTEISIFKTGMSRVES
jgi:hypothetical protein